LKEGRILTHCSSASEAERPFVALHPAKPNNAKIAQFDGMRNEEDTYGTFGAWGFRVQ
jgi:hypothetical protein